MFPGLFFPTLYDACAVRNGLLEVFPKPYKTLAGTDLVILLIREIIKVESLRLLRQAAVLLLNIIQRALNMSEHHYS